MKGLRVFMNNFVNRLSFHNNKEEEEGNTVQKCVAKLKKYFIFVVS